MTRNLKLALAVAVLIAVSATVGAAQEDSYTRGKTLQDAGKVAEAVGAYQEACDGGNAKGCNNLGVMYLDGTGVAKDATRATALIQKACDGGNAKGCNNLGVIYLNGTGVAKDTTKATALFQMVCDEDEAVGCDNLGVIYLNGTGVTKDEAKAHALFQKACDGNVFPGCFRLAFSYENGRGIAKDPGRATPLYQKACDGGHAQGCNNLGLKYQNGSGVAKDATKAAALYQKSCDGSHALGCANLARHYENGVGVTKDTGRAAALYQKACDGGNAKGCAKGPITTAVQGAGAANCAAVYGVAASNIRSERSLAAAAARAELIDRLTTYLKGFKDAVATLVADADKRVIPPPGQELNLGLALPMCDEKFSLEVAKKDDGEINADGGRVFRANAGNPPQPSAPTAAALVCAQIYTSVQNDINNFKDEMARYESEMSEPSTDSIRNAKRSIMRRSADHYMEGFRNAAKAADAAGCGDVATRIRELIP